MMKSPPGVICSLGLPALPCERRLPLLTASSRSTCHIAAVADNLSASSSLEACPAMNARTCHAPHRLQY